MLKIKTASTTRKTTSKHMKEKCLLWVKNTQTKVSTYVEVYTWKLFEALDFSTRSLSVLQTVFFYDGFCKGGKNMLLTLVRNIDFKCFYDDILWLDVTNICCVLSGSKKKFYSILLENFWIVLFQYEVKYKGSVLDIKSISKFILHIIFANYIVFLLIKEFFSSVRMILIFRWIANCG